MKIVRGARIVGSILRSKDSKVIPQDDQCRLPIGTIHVVRRMMLALSRNRAKQVTLVMVSTLDTATQKLHLGAALVAQ
ncbi:uncharacterized protein CANTADRAFT_107959 [Suhomyces tanzawaensis NRRL Y-17324]|uniref:Uncharacterized protein n=1 Tax=Suhomyces tanzawaensis NRRL Y-17324 TaxID=984487 RepID=A0A1E4SPN5_9ASCO|nr:uncharacterized protein CANTADRAFT_107959 [Suhomyces tanzawaensis NRRL Y-17324]ODV81448.1 hypothetical protein CANTADRAFT_107959 [Suhomyces tanzawaensis NRRL Y-17324]